MHWGTNWKGVDWSWLFCVNLTDHEVPRFNIISECVCKGVLDEISIWTGELSKADLPSACGWASSNLLRAWIEQREQRATSLSYWAEMSIFSCPWTLEFLVLRPLDSKTLACSPPLHCQALSLRLGVTPLIPLILRTLDSGWIILIALALLVLQITDSMLCHISTSIITWANSL